MKIVAALILFSLCLSLSAQECVKLSDSTDLVTHCKTMIVDYPRPVHFYIPQNLSSEKKLKLFVHFHGHNIEGYNHFDKRWGDYGSYLIESKANAVLVIPESVGNCTSYDSFFAKSANSARFFLQLEKKVEELAQFKIHSLVLSGHSGAYRVLNRLMKDVNNGEDYFSATPLVALGLFDAIYGPIPEIVNWVEENATTRHSEELRDFLFYEAHVAGPKATTEEGSKTLIAKFKNLSSEKIIFKSVMGLDSESLLDQHFAILKRGSLANFWKNLAF